MLPVYKSPKRRIPRGGDGTQAASDRVKFLADCLLRGLIRVMPTRRVMSDAAISGVADRTVVSNIH